MTIETTREMLLRQLRRAEEDSLVDAAKICSLEAQRDALLHACLVAIGFLNGVSILNKWQVNNALVHAVKTTGKT
jgi:hypothetical protein